MALRAEGGRVFPLAVLSRVGCAHRFESYFTRQGVGGHSPPYELALLDSRLRGNDKVWGVQRGIAPLCFFYPPKIGGQGG